MKEGKILEIDTSVRMVAINYLKGMQKYSLISIGMRLILQHHLVIENAAGFHLTSGVYNKSAVDLHFQH